MISPALLALLENDDVDQLVLPLDSDALCATPCALHWAASTAPRCLQRMLALDEATRALVDATDGTGASPLHYGADAGVPEAVEALLNAGARVDMPDDAGDTPLHWACLSGASLAVVTLLLERGANADATNKAGRRPADHARANGHAAIVERLASKPATRVEDVNAAADVVVAAVAVKSDTAVVNNNDTTDECVALRAEVARLRRANSRLDSVVTHLLAVIAQLRYHDDDDDDDDTVKDAKEGVKDAKEGDV